MNDWICKICGKQVTSMCAGMCDTCRFLLLGEKMNDSCDYAVETHDGIVIWIKDLKIDSVWVEGGNRAISDEIVKGMTPVQAIEFLRKFDKFCTTCNTPVKEFAGTHFAGAYCRTCWGKYKKDNSRVCTICTRPIYECCC